MHPRLISNDELKAAVRKAIEDGTLLAMAPRYSGPCRYQLEHEGKIYYCAVGAALTSSELSHVETSHIQEGSCHHLQRERVILFEDIYFADRLQQRHDMAATGQSTMDRFLSFLNAEEVAA